MEGFRVRGRVSRVLRATGPGGAELAWRPAGALLTGTTAGLLFLLDLILFPALHNELCFDPTLPFNKIVT